jgi:hypothetical protein
MIDSNRKEPHMRGLLWSRKELRDEEWRRMKAMGIRATRFTTGPQEIHPMYVEDLKDYGAGRDRGFGNTVYKTLFKQLYGLEWSEAEVPISKIFESWSK